jgi:hypothetical protein
MNPEPRLRPLVELGVDEAHALLEHHFQHQDLPPIEAVENEDWGRDYLLARLQSLPESALNAAGLTAIDLAAPADGEP